VSDETWKRDIERMLVEQALKFGPAFRAGDFLASVSDGELALLGRIAGQALEERSQPAIQALLNLVARLVAAENLDRNPARLRGRLSVDALVDLFIVWHRFIGMEELRRRGLVRFPRTLSLTGKSFEFEFTAEGEALARRQRGHDGEGPT
jgi:hypothetical protein